MLTHPMRNTTLNCYSVMLCFRGESNTSMSCRSALLYIASSKTRKRGDSDLLSSSRNNLSGLFSFDAV